MQSFRAAHNDNKTMTHHQLQSHQNHRLPIPATIQAARLPMRADLFSEHRPTNGVFIVERIS
jgi:hypothetical protein